MDGIGHFAPAGDLGGRVDSRLGIEGRVALYDHRGLGNDQSRQSTLGVILGHESARHMVRFGAAARERSHENAIGDFDGSELERLEKW
jgi:hypothetical protein